MGTKVTVSEVRGGKSGLGGSQDFDYVRITELVKPVEGKQAKIEGCIFYALALFAVAVMVIVVLNAAL